MSAGISRAMILQNRQSPVLSVVPGSVLMRRAYGESSRSPVTVAELAIS
jgi:hypothetical protein